MASVPSQVANVLKESTASKGTLLAWCVGTK